MYAKCFKRVLDFSLSLIALIILSPILLILTAVGAIAMGGNPFFTQLRPGKIDRKSGKEKIFRLVKFRTMSNKRDQNGKLLPDNVRLNKYGRILRSTSLDELPELWNILKGDMSIVGPRPLAVQYLEYYNENERRRHSVLPGLTGLAQINGRNTANWPERFAYDLEYVTHISFRLDVSIVLKTFMKVLKRSDVTTRATGTVMDFDQYRRLENEGKVNRDEIFVEKR